MSYSGLSLALVLSAISLSSPLVAQQVSAADDLTAQVAVRRQHAEVPGDVAARGRHQGTDPCERAVGASPMEVVPSDQGRLSSSLTEPSGKSCRWSLESGGRST